jgi:hypothetical protein
LDWERVVVVEVEIDEFVECTVNPRAGGGRAVSEICVVVDVGDGQAAPAELRPQLGDTGVGRKRVRF